MTPLHSLRQRTIAKAFAILSRTKWVFTILAVSICMVAIGAAIFLHRPVAVSDQDRQQDLFKIETAVIDHMTGDSLPADINALHLSGLKGSARDYTYRYSQRSSNGGPTLTFELCGTFQAATFKAPMTENDEQVMLGAGGEGAEAYRIHRKGQQCYTNGYYKGSSHIGPIFNKGEVIPTMLPANHTDFKQLVPKVEAQYRAQVTLLGSTYTDQDLSKTCKQSSNPSDATNHVAYDCRIGLTGKYAKIIPVSHAASETKEVADQFVGLLKQQGYQYPSSTDESSNVVEVTTSDEHCRTDATIWTSQVTYSFSCYIPTVPYVPEGFVLE